MIATNHDDYLFPEYSPIKYNIIDKQNLLDMYVNLIKNSLIVAVQLGSTMTHSQKITKLYLAQLLRQ